MMNSSADNITWNNDIPNILESTEELKDGYKISRIVAMVPENTGFVGVQFLANSDPDASIKLAKVTFMREAGTTPKGELISDLGGGGGEKGKVMKPGMEDPLNDWSNVEWHSEGIIFAQGNEKLFGDFGRTIRTSDTWQGFNYRIQGVRRVEVKLFFKGDASPTYINVSDDNKEWYDVPWHIGKITSINGEWKTSTTYAIIPETAKFVTVQMLESKIGEQTPQIGNVRFLKDPGELPPSMRDVLEDTLDDFSLIYWHSDGIKIVSDDAGDFGNDALRIGRSNNSWQGINYKAHGTRRVDVKVFYKDTPSIQINYSYDNKAYMDAALIYGKPENLSNGWKSAIVTAILPEDIGNIGINLNENKDGPLSPQIGSVTLFKSEGEVPQTYKEENPAKDREEDSSSGENIGDNTDKTEDLADDKRDLRIEDVLRTNAGVKNLYFLH